MICLFSDATLYIFLIVIIISFIKDNNNVTSFQVLWNHQHQHHYRHTIITSTSTSSLRLPIQQLYQSTTTDNDNDNVDNDMFDGWTNERKNNVFQTLLRDLQIENVPLLSIDGSQTVYTMHAAIWTTICELYDNNIDNNENNNKVCMIFDEIPISALRSLVDEYLIIKTSKTSSSISFIDMIPELNHVSLSLVGKGVGPGLIIEIDKSDSNSVGSSTNMNNNEGNLMNIMKQYMNRMLVQQNICPYYKEYSTTIRYRMCSSGTTEDGNNIFHILSSFWNRVCELSIRTNTELSSTVLCLLPNHNKDDTLSFQKFVAITEILNRIFILYRGDTVFDILYFHPNYNRNEIQPVDQPILGHLPPYTWFQAMMDGGQPTNTNNDDTLLSYYNYQRRSPFMSICIKRLNMIEDVTSRDNNGMIELSIPVDDTDLGNMVVNVPKSIVMTQKQNIKTLQTIGLDTLYNELQNEIQQIQNVIVG